jgi:hypothetical protein
MDLSAPRHLVVIALVLLLYWLVLWPFALIFSRAGHSKWLALVMIIPIINVVVLWWFAKTKWAVAPQDIGLAPVRQ